MTLIACFPSCLNIAIQLAYTYSCNWRYQFNYGKTRVVVFGECAVTHSKNIKVRQWNVGPNHIYEKSEYVKMQHYEACMGQVCTSNRMVWRAITD